MSKSDYGPAGGGERGGVGPTVGATVDWPRLAFGREISPIRLDSSAAERLESLNLLWDATAPTLSESSPPLSRADAPPLTASAAASWFDFPPPATPAPRAGLARRSEAALVALPELPPDPAAIDGAAIRVPLREELTMARRLYRQCSEQMLDLLGRARQGGSLPLAALEPLTVELLDSLERCPDALLLLSQLRSKDQYTFQHLVSVGVLLMLFARSMGMERDVVVQIGLGGLLHDIGKSRIPGRLLHNPQGLSRSDREELRLHVSHGCEMLQGSDEVGRIPKEIVAQHHERFDGSGYPLQLQGKEVGWYGQMAGIVDVYDSLIAGRGRRQGLPPTLALGRILSDQAGRFNPAMVQPFIRAVGVYPTGSLVQLRSGKLAVVLEQNPAERLRPRVQVIYHSRHRMALRPEEIDLAQSEEQIEGHDSFLRWGLDPERYLPH